MLAQNMTRQNGLKFNVVLLNHMYYYAHDNKRRSIMGTIQKVATKAGLTRYRASIRIKGHKSQTATFSKISEAKKWSQSQEGLIHSGLKKSDMDGHALYEAIERYKKFNLTSQRIQQLGYWQNAIGSLFLKSITPQMIAKYRDEILSNRSPATATRYLAALSHVFTVAIREWGWCDNNPVKDVTKPKEPRGRVRFLSDEEREKLFDAAKKSNSKYLYSIIVLCLATGARKMEILGLKWSEIDFENSIITIPTQRTKNGEPKPLHISKFTANLLMLLNGQRGGSDLVFEGPLSGKPIDIRASWGAILKKTGIKDFRFHDLRHSAASALAMNGASLAEIAEILGHKSLNMVKRYAHFSTAHTQKVVDSMNSKIFGE